MPSTPRWGGLRPEPYDPDARDADGDGIVQEGTAFERPFGTRILDQLGRDIIKGSNLLSRDGLQYRDRNNQPVMVNGVPYAPQAVSLQSSETALGRIGHATIGGQLGTISNPAPPPVSEIVPPAPRKLGDSWMYITGRVPLSERVKLEDRKAQKRFGPVIEELEKIHGADSSSLWIRVRRGKKSKTQGGTFWRNGEDGHSRPELVAAEITGQPDSDMLSFLHEYGHSLDNHALGFISEQTGRRGEPLPEMTDFLRVASIDSPSFIERLARMRAEGADETWLGYHQQCNEIWARAYMQYTVRELEKTGSPLGIKLGEALDLMQTEGHRQWDDAEFAEHIGPAVEEVLRARGMLHEGTADVSAVREATAITHPVDTSNTPAYSLEPRTLSPLPRRSRVPDPLTQSAYRHDATKKVGEGDGSEANPFKVASSSEALALINDGHHVEMDETTLAVVLNDLQAYAREAKAAEKSGSVFEHKDYDLCRAHVPDTNFFCEQHRGIVRLEMPQVAGKNMLPGSKAAAKLEEQKAAGLKNALEGEVDLGADFLEFLTSQGVSFGDVTKQDAVTMKATQRQLVGAKVGGMMNGYEAGAYNPGEVPIIMSSDGFIFDGHHRWAAMVGADHLDGEDTPLQMNVRVIDLPIEQLLAQSKTFLADWGMLGNAANANNAAEETEQKVIALPKTASESQKKLVDGFISVEQRVLDEHGPITNAKEAEAALNKAFPDSTITLDLGETMTARDHGAITGLLAAAITDPDAAKSIGTITISSKPGGKSTAVIETVTTEGGLPRYGMNFVLNTSGTYETGVGFGLNQGVVGDISSLHEQGHPTEILDRFDSTYQALHEYGHAVALQRQLADAGLDLSAEQDIEWWGQFGDTIGHDFRGELDKRKYRKDPDKAAERINELLQDPIVQTKLTDTIDVHSADGLSPEDALSVKKMVNERSALSAHSNQEMAAEIFALEHLGIDPSDAGLHRRLKEPDYVSPEGTVVPSAGESEAAAAMRIFNFEKEHKEGRRSYADIKAWLLGDRDGDGVAKEGSARETIIGRASGSGPRTGSSELSPESKRRAMASWVINPKRLREDAETYLGRAPDADLASVVESDTVGMAERGSNETHAILADLRDNGEDLAVLYRGLAPGTASHETDNLVVGESIDIPLVGASRDRAVAGARFHGDRHGGTMIVFERPVGMSINERLPDHEYADEDEWITGGRYEVVSIVEEASTLPFLRRRPTSMYGEDAGGDRFEDWAAPVTATTPKRIITLRQRAIFDPDKLEGSTKSAKPKLQTLGRGELVSHPFAKALSDAITPAKPRGRLTPTKNGGLNVHIAAFPHKSRVASPPKPDTSDRPATKSLIETKGLRPQLIVEPYDPDAQDGDGDGIVQEGTAFERPVGSRLIDEAGKDIVRGFTSISEMKLRTVDKDGNPVENKRIPRQPAGEAKEKVKGVLDAFSLAKRKSTLSSQGHRSIGTGLPKLESLGHKSVIDRVAPKPPKPAKVKKKLPSVRKKRSAHAPTAVLETYERDKARVAELHGDVSTADKAHAAISKAFPRLEAEFLFNGEAEWKAKPDAPLSPDERGWVTSLLVLADDHPEAAKALRVLSTHSMTHHDMDEATNAFVTVQPFFSDDLEEDMHIFGALLAFNPDGSILPNSKKKRFGRKDKRYTGTANEEHIQELLSSKQITVEQAHELTSAYTATHEFGHVIHFTQTIKDMGIDITDPTKNDENIVKFLEIGLGKKLDLPDPDVDTLDWRTAVDEILTNADDAFYAEWDRALTAASFDALNDDQVYAFLDVASGVSEYATTGVDEGLGYEAFAELFAAEKWGIAHQPDEWVGKMRDWTDVVVGEDNGAGPALTLYGRQALTDLQTSIDSLEVSTQKPARVSSTATGPRKVEIPERARDKIKRLLNLRHGSERDNSPRENTPEQEAIAKVLADDFFKVNGVSKHGNPWNTRIDSAELTDAVDHYDFGDDETIHHIIVMGTIVDSETGKPIGTFTRTIDLRDPKNPIVNNDSFQMNADQQHNGIGKSFLTQTLSNYHAGGIDKVTLQASSTRPVKSDNPANSANTGFTTWAKLGAERGGTYGIQGLDVGELERIIGKPSDEITADDIRAHWSSLVGLDLITDMTFDLSNGLPKELLSGASATKAASQKQQPISLEEWNSILDDYVPMSPEMELAQKRKRNRYQLCHRPDGQPGLPLVKYDYDREK